MRTKLDYTRKLLLQLPEHEQLSEAQALDYWWRDIRYETCLRLSAQGYQAFKTLGITEYKFDIPPAIPAKANALLVLSRKLTCPYFIQIGKTPALVLFGSKEATIYSLYGDINRYLKMLGSSD